jgi:peroxin-12
MSDRDNGRKSSQLSLNKRVFSLVCLVMVPYLKVKVERLYSSLTDENDSTPITWHRGQSTKQLLKFVIFYTVPYLQSVWTLSFFIFRFRYLLSSSLYYSPLHWMAGVRIVRQLEDVQGSSSPASSMSSWRWLVAQLFSLSLFSLKLVQWWYSEERAAVFKKMSSLPVPPPPPRVQPSSDSVHLPSDLRLCPLCHQTRREPTALCTSGYVFCYDCIASYITNFSRCPLTSLPCSHKQLVRLFVNNQNYRWCTIHACGYHNIQSYWCIHFNKW